MVEQAALCSLHQLSRELGDDQPFYGIEPEGLDGNQFHRLTVEQMATHYLAEIRRVQPNGPYYIGGYCFGGLVAFEMARMLRQQGEELALVALFSAALRFNHLTLQPSAQSPDHQPLGPRLARVLSSPAKTLRNISTATYWRARLLARQCAQRSLFRLGFRLPPGMRTMYVLETLGRAEQNFKPKPYSGPIVLFCGPGNDEYGPDLGWDGLAEHIEHHVIGDQVLDSRRDILIEPLVGATAKALAPYLNANVGASLPHEALKVV